MENFNKLILDQFVYGGKKYAKDDQRESTDILVDRYGTSWLLGTMDKYTFRYTNLQRERDILKIATYSFIFWLKKGFWIKEKGLSDIIDTNVKIKEQYFPCFVSKVEEYKYGAESILYRKYLMDEISNTIWRLSKVEWLDVSASQLYKIYYLCYLKWKECYENIEKHDTDTYDTQKQ